MALGTRAVWTRLRLPSPVISGSLTIMHFYTSPYAAFPVPEACPFSWNSSGCQKTGPSSPGGALLASGMPLPV